MAAPPARRTERPPYFDLDDRGLKWYAEGQTLRLVRRPNLLAILWPSLLASGTFGGGIWLLLLREWLPGAVLVFSTLFSGAFLWARATGRAEITLGPDRTEWRQSKPRRFVGSWASRDLEGVRLVFGHEPAAWGHRRDIMVEVRRRGEWVVLGSGNSERRATDLAEAIAATRGWAVAVHDEDKDGALPR